MADKNFPLGDGSSLVKMTEAGNGGHAKTVYSASSAESSSGDKLVEVGDGITKKRLRNMGDGTHAEVKFGA